ncbi:MAG: ATP-binding protein, partial [Patescibacteria group bacterium]|nr:ATP-binding protein [Patescibacteria group bacterium]
GQSQIPITPEIPSIDETLEEILNRHPYREKVFDTIAYLIFRSPRFAADRILRSLHAKASLQAMTLEYLMNKGISVPKSRMPLNDFVSLWKKELRRKTLDEIRTISNELRFLGTINLTTAWLENAIRRIEDIEPRLLFDLDQQRVRHLQKILETSLDLCKEFSFEEQERLSIQIDSRCRDLLMEIKDSPTKLSVEEIYPVVESVQEKVQERLGELYETATPQITLRLPIESYIPDNNLQIEVQIVVENKPGRSPAESLELIVQEDDEFFVVNVPEIKLNESLRGGERHILEIPLQVTVQAVESQTFSLPVYAQYRSRSEEIKQTDIETFSIRLYPEEEFKEIENPYAAYAKGGIVADPEMFYGREELIQNIATVIYKSRAQSKCITVYGQKRAGKSSILHHLKKRLEKRKDILILDLGDIRGIFDAHSSAPLLYRILRNILWKLELAIEDRVDEGFIPLDLTFPKDREFYAHPSPLILFKDVFDRYLRQASKLDDWHNVRIVVLIDEFSEIYTQIVAKKIPEMFMKNWKALLQENYFSAVLAGQDVMPKFKQRFPNEFGTAQDEPVSCLRREDAIKLIDEPIRIGGREGESRYREQAIKQILDLSARNPFYIQILCNRLVEYMNRKRAPLVTEAYVKHVKNDLIRYLDIADFDNLIDSGDTSEDAISYEDALKVLKAIAINSRTGSCNRNNITCETNLPVEVILDDLRKRDVIEREREQYYQIRVGLFKEWLIANQ